MTAAQASVSIVCVFNDPAVRQQCLDQSIQSRHDEAAGVEYLPIDNVNGAYRSAGAALNYGAQLAKNDVVVFVHQDVYLHSLTALKRAAGQMLAHDFGVVGAIGVCADGRIIGRIRDRVVLLGEAVTDLTDVDSVDEVLFMAPRSQLRQHPLIESDDMAWHAYAVEYGLRIRRQGLRAGVTDIPLTHNSLSTNVDRLDVAHRAIAAYYANLLPIRTTCGVISTRNASTNNIRLFPSHRWRYRWLRESIALRRAHAAAAGRLGVLADIRLDIDGLIERCPGRKLHIINRSPDDNFVDAGPGHLELQRREGQIIVGASGMPGIAAALTSSSAGSWLLLTNLTRADLQLLGSLALGNLLGTRLSHRNRILAAPGR